MNVALDAITTAAMKLVPEDRSQLATWLWESAAGSIPTRSEAALESLLNQREAEMDSDLSQEISHEDLMAHFANRR